MCARLSKAGVVTNVLTWMASIVLMLAIFLGVWEALLTLYRWLPEAVPQRQEIVAYLLGGVTDGVLEVTYLNFVERYHLLDVRQLFTQISDLFYGVLAVSVLLLGLQRRFAQGRVLVRTGYLGLAAILLPGVVMLLGGFVPLFIFLHTLLFPEGTWVFPDDSPLIQLFPLAYFFRFGMVYVGALVLIFAGLLVWGKLRKEAHHAYRHSQGNQK